MTKIIFSEQFVKQLNELQDYITDVYQAPLTALKTRNNIERHIQKLIFKPELGIKLKQVIPQIADEYKLHRRLLINRYVLIFHYDKKQNTLYIDALFHQTQNYLSLFSE